jgi:hypothetical protein
VGAFLNDRFSGYLMLKDSTLSKIPEGPEQQLNRARPHTLRLVAGWIGMIAGIWMLVSPQALLGLDELKWIHNYAFSGEVLPGALVMTIALYLLSPAAVVDPIRETLSERVSGEAASSTTTNVT